MKKEFISGGLASKLALIMSMVPATVHSCGLAIEWLLPTTALNVVNYMLPSSALISQALTNSSPRMRSSR